VARWADTFTGEALARLAGAADPDRAGPMRAYMRDQFPFLGVPSAGQTAAFRQAWALAGPPPGEADVVAAVDALWAAPAREPRYLGSGLVRRWAPEASAGFVEPIGRWITDRPWWDTCDALARHGAGAVVRAHPDVRTTMDDWLAGDDLWLTRTALLHMGAWKHEIDRDWVFAACLARADHPDFFIRKAIGWILRDLAWVDPDAVAGFVDGPGAVLSALSKREALKHVPGRGSRA
jgi:3-methyladenine DNA glycosylase AlkD